MDIPLFGLALLTFAVLYLGLNVFLFWAIVITFLVIMMYLAIRYKSVAENYPHGLGDTLTLVVLVAITWVLFVFLGPKNPLPFIGAGLVSSQPDWGLITAVALVFIFLVMILFAILIPVLQGRMSMGGGGGDDMGGGKPKMGVGAG